MLHPGTLWLTLQERQYVVEKPLAGDEGPLNLGLVHLLGVVVQFHFKSPFRNGGATSRAAGYTRIDRLFSVYRR